MIIGTGLRPKILTSFSLNIQQVKDFGVYSSRVHLFPFRTEKLSLLALMVLPF